MWLGQEVITASPQNKETWVVGWVPAVPQDSWFTLSLICRVDIARVLQMRLKEVTCLPLPHSSKWQSRGFQVSEHMWGGVSYSWVDAENNTELKDITYRFIKIKTVPRENEHKK